MEFEGKNELSLEDYEEATGMMQANAIEAGTPWPLDIDVWQYIDEPSYHTFTLRKVGKLVGYAIFRVHKHHHYGKLVAGQDVIYVDPSYRSGGTAVRFVKKIEMYLRDISVEAIFQSSTRSKDISRFLEGMGYEQTETIFMKELV